MNYPSIETDLLRTFVAIADQGGFTRAAEVVNRTQSAVSMQMRKLEEDVLQRRLFERDGRQVRLTAEGQVLLGFARRILKLHGEVMTTLREPHMVGTVRIGTPDDYVMRFIPGILAGFAKAYPLVQVDVHCEPTAGLLQRQDLDLTIVTREPGNEIGLPLRRERFVWAEAPGFDIHQRDPLPLAMFNTSCFLSEWARRALDNRDRGYRLAYSSPSLAALLGIVKAGLAVTAQLESLLPSELRRLGEADGMPDLPSCSISELLRNPRSASPIIDTLAEHIAEGFRQ